MVKWVRAMHNRARQSFWTYALKKFKMVVIIIIVHYTAIKCYNNNKVYLVHRCVLVLITVLTCMTFRSLCISMLNFGMILYVITIDWQWALKLTVTINVREYSGPRMNRLTPHPLYGLNVKSSKKYRSGCPPPRKGKGVFPQTTKTCAELTFRRALPARI